MRATFVTLSLIFAAGSTFGSNISIEELSVDAGSGKVTTRCYATPGHEPRPVVVLLHGGSGYDRFSRQYEMYADALAARGFRVCAVLYYTPEDLNVMAGNDRAARQARYDSRFTSWLAAVNTAIDRLSELESTTPGSIGVLGFSQGAYLAVAAAGTNQRVKALVEFYGGVPSLVEKRISHLPATLIVHGEDDKVVPVNEAYAMETFARTKANSYTMKIYKSAGHGFDSKQTDAAVDARRRTVEFFVGLFSGSRT